VLAVGIRQERLDRPRRRAAIARRAVRARLLADAPGERRHLIFPGFQAEPRDVVILRQVPELREGGPLGPARLVLDVGALRVIPRASRLLGRPLDRERGTGAEPS